MQSDSRYEILDTIATGEFATVYRARDRDLGREVAVKQIHDQYLADPRQLARYWQEAQLLASLQHPNIVTIYDVVRARGWLILELMKSSLKPSAEGEPIDLDQLRLVLANCLHGLHFLHTNGVIHGDIKPSNILIAPPNRIKLGDFGLARRASNEEGSLLKGTTKYMAPELLSSQFGAVGPASDLYSLGFTAYELMVGAQFESLFPTLATFGRNKQMAWMMWHSTADAKLPDVARVLEGVPEDLAHAIQKLIAKDQSQRYRSAAEALRDVQGKHGLVDSLPDSPDLDAEAAEAEAQRRKKRIRTFSILAACCSVVLASLIVVMWPKPKPRRSGPAGPDRGVIVAVFPAEKMFGIAPSDGSPAKEIRVKDGDTIIINDESQHMLRDLAEHDAVVVQRSIDEKTHNVVQEIRAFRPKAASGRIHSFDIAAATFVVRTDEDHPRDLTISVPEDLHLRLNGLAEFQGKPIRLPTLVRNDRVTVHYVPQEDGQKATEVDAERVVDLQGALAEDFDAKTGLLSIVTGSGELSRVVKLPFAAQYVITINGQPAAKPTSLRKDDRATLKHDRKIVELRAVRTLGAGGVVQQIRYEPPQTLNVADDAGGEKKTYLVLPNCKITLGDEPVLLDVLRTGDRVRIEHATINAKSQEAINATSIAAERPADATRWALIIAVQNYDDKQLSPLGFPLADAAQLAETLGKRYRVPADHLRVFNDPSAVSLEREIPDFMKLVGSDGRLIVYYVGHAVKDDKAGVLLAPKDFNLKQPEANGRPLQWLVDLMEECPAKEKLLLLDAGYGNDKTGDPSASDLIRGLKPRENRALLRTVTAVAGCQKGQLSRELSSKSHGLFGLALAEGFGGAADANRDTRIEPTELYTYLQRAMPAAATEIKAMQTPELFLPDDRPPRLTDAAKTSIRRLAGFTAQAKVNIIDAEQEYNAAQKVAGAEIEPRLIHGLLLLKVKDRENSTKEFEVLKSEMPKRLLPHVALAWLRIEKRSYPAAANELLELVNVIPKPSTTEGPISPEARFLFQWTGQLREYITAAVADPTPQLKDSLAALDAAIVARGGEAADFYGKGRKHSEGVMAQFDQKMSEAKDEATEGTLKVQRRLLVNYADFPLSKYVQQVIAHLDE